MVDGMVFEKCWCLVWWVGRLSISSSIMEYFWWYQNLLQVPRQDQAPGGRCRTHHDSKK